MTFGRHLSVERCRSPPPERAAYSHPGVSAEELGSSACFDLESLDGSGHLDLRPFWRFCAIIAHIVLQGTAMLSEGQGGRETPISNPDRGASSDLAGPSAPRSLPAHREGSRYGGDGRIEGRSGYGEVPARAAVTYCRSETDTRDRSFFLLCAGSDGPLRQWVSQQAARERTAIPHPLERGRSRGLRVISLTRCSGGLPRCGRH